MLRARLASGALAVVFALVGLAPLPFADGGPFGTPSASVVAWAGTCLLLALAMAMLAVLVPPRRARY